jgi:dTMP kinase
MTGGLFITLEGGEGAGKTTQARRLKSHLESRGRKVVLTREPGGTPQAEKIRALLVQRDSGVWSPLAECALFFIARHEHIETLIKPCLAEGAIVVCDRFTDSTIAYQGYGHGFDLDEIARIDALMTKSFRPDLTLIFDLPVEAGLRRAVQQKARAGGAESTEDKFEKLDIAFHARMRDGFLKIAKSNAARCHVVDAAATPDFIASKVAEIVDRRLADAL